MVVHNVEVGNSRIKTTITSSGYVASTWIYSILRFHCNRLDSLLVGVNVKWCPHRKHGTRGKNPIATLQLCVGRHCLIFQLIYCDNIPENLRQFLANNQFRFNAEGIRGAAARLKKDYHVRFGQRIEDLREIAARKMRKPAVREYGLRTLAWVVKELDPRNPRSVRLSDWGTEKLNEKQIECAAVDAFLTFTVGVELVLSY